jgi:hypothetical protein
MRWLAVISRNVRRVALLLTILASLILTFLPAYAPNGETLAEVNGPRIYWILWGAVAVAALPLLFRPLRFISGVLLVVLGCLSLPHYLIPGLLMFAPDRK